MDSVQPKSDGQSNRDPIRLEADHLCFLDVEASIIVFTLPISDVQNRHETESKRERVRAMFLSLARMLPQANILDSLMPKDAFGSLASRENLISCDSEEKRSHNGEQGRTKML
jgi:hypothetical protein